jgi:hypothetical protein
LHSQNPTQVSSTQLRGPPCFVGQNCALAAQFQLLATSSPPSCAPLDCADPGPKPRLTPPQLTPHYPNPSPCAHRSRKPGPCGSAFDFQPQTSPLHAVPDCADPGPKPQLTPPQSTLHYPNLKSPAHRSGKSSPGGSIFGFQPQMPSLRAPLDCTDPGSKPQLTPPQSTPHYPNPKPPAHRSGKLSPHGSVFSIWPQTPPLAHHWTARTQAPNFSLHRPNRPHTIQIRSPLHVVCKN